MVFVKFGKPCFDVVGKAAEHFFFAFFHSALFGIKRYHPFAYRQHGFYAKQFAHLRGKSGYPAALLQILQRIHGDIHAVVFSVAFKSVGYFVGVHAVFNHAQSRFHRFSKRHGNSVVVDNPYPAVVFFRQRRRRGVRRTQRRGYWQMQNFFTACVQKPVPQISERLRRRLRSGYSFVRFQRRVNVGRRDVYALIIRFAVYDYRYG